ncbi:uncharacterized protein A4U43_C09F10140 [Asparagus officinalis]|uniref:Uncharacterized protein n=1 Tax=Asparagus officinalis TaxID=4686 RepID=A0A5P1E9W0_ASPOF|nr:uncharacterized protein A4U43_C09F10140 [Asparagus officinalis]
MVGDGRAVRSGEEQLMMAEGKREEDREVFRSLARSELQGVEEGRVDDVHALFNLHSRTRNTVFWQCHQWKGQPENPFCNKQELEKTFGDTLKG